MARESDSALLIKQKQAMCEVSPVWFVPEHHLPPAVHWMDPAPAAPIRTWSDQPPLLGFEHTQTTKKELPAMH